MRAFLSAVLTVAALASPLSCRQISPSFMPHWDGQTRDPDPTVIPNEAATARPSGETRGGTAPAAPGPGETRLATDGETLVAFALGLVVQLLAGGTPAPGRDARNPLLFGISGVFDETDPMRSPSGEGSLLPTETAAEAAPEPAVPEPAVPEEGPGNAAER